MPSSGLFAALGVPQYRRLVSGQVLSGFGDWIDYVAVIYLVAYQWHGGAGGLAAVSVAAAVPWMVLSPFAGVWADRLPQQRTMIACDLFRAALVLCYLAAPNLGVLLVLLVVKTAAGTLFGPAEQSALTQVVPAERLLSANSLSAFVNQAAKVAGPAAGGLLIAVSSPHWAFVADAATFVASALILSRLGLPPRPRPRGAAQDGTPDGNPDKGRFRRELREGFSFVLGNRILLMAVGSLSATVLLVMAFDTLSPLVLAKLGLGHALYGPALGAIAAGAVVGTLVVGTWGQRWNAFGVLACSQAATGALVALTGAAAITGFRMAPLLWGLVAVGIGLCSTGIIVVFQYLVQRATPQELMGRVVAVVGVVPTVLQIAAPVLGAALAVLFGLGWVLLAAGGCLALLGALFLVLRPPDTTPEAAADTEADTADTAAAPEAVADTAGGTGEAPAEADAPATPPVRTGPTDGVRPDRPERQAPTRRRTDMAYDAIEALAAAGHSFEGATEEQLSVISTLSEHEVSVMNAIKERLDGQVAGHSAVAPVSTVGGFVW
jgi:MFS family permease